MTPKEQNVLVWSLEIRILKGSVPCQNTGQVDVTENVTINVTENVTSLAVRFKVTERTIKRDLKALQTLGVIKHDGPNNGGRWIVI